MAVQVLRRRFTVDEYHLMGQVGILGEDDRVELLEGEIVEMAPIGSRHQATVDRLTELFSRRVGDSASIRGAGPGPAGWRLGAGAGSYIAAKANRLLRHCSPGS